MNCAPLSVGPPRCEPFPVLALEARTSHWVSIAANDRGTGPQEVLKARENQGCSRSIGPTRPCGRNPEIERVSGIFSAPVSPPRSALRGNRGSCGAVIIRPRHRYRKTRLLPPAASTVHSRFGTAAARPGGGGAGPGPAGRVGPEAPWIAQADPCGSVVGPPSLQPPGSWMDAWVREPDHREDGSGRHDHRSRRH